MKSMFVKFCGKKKKSFVTFTKNYSTLEDGGYDLNMNSYTHSELETS